MAFDGSEGDWVSLGTAAAVNLAYRNANPGSIKGVFLGKEKLQVLLNQANAEGIRFYFGNDGNGKMKIVAVAADKMENDILSKILDKGDDSPPFEGVANALNS